MKLKYFTLTLVAVGVLSACSIGDDNDAEVSALQAQVEQLSKEDLLKFKSTKNISHKLLKMFLGDETDLMIDHFNACGGKKGSAKFIKNMIGM